MTKQAKADENDNEARSFGGSAIKKASDLTNAQKAAKATADELLEMLLGEHLLYSESDDARNVSDPRRLTWNKLEPVFDIYKNNALGAPDLSGRKMDFANFSNSKFPPETNFANASLNFSSFQSSVLYKLDFSGCQMMDCGFWLSKIRECNFFNAVLCSSNFGQAILTDCNFDEANASRAKFDEGTFIENSSFRNAALEYSDFSVCYLKSNDFTSADLKCAILVQTVFHQAILTGAILYGTARDNWKLDEIDCQYVFWDKKGVDRFPPESDFEDGEFITQYRDYTGFSYTFKNGMTPLDLIFATHIVNQINAAEMGFTIKIDNASIRGLNPTLNFIMEAGEDKKADARELFKQEYEKQIRTLEKELQKVTERLLTERGARADFAEKHLAISAEHQQIMNQFFMPLVSEFLQRKDSFGIKQLSHQKAEQSTGEVQKVLLCDKLLTIQVGENEPVVFGSVKQYAVFKAVIQSSKTQGNRIDLEQIGDIAREIEEALTPAKEKKRPGWQPIASAKEISGICFDLREYCEKNPRLSFLIPLVLQKYKKTIPLAGYEIEEVETISGGLFISDY